MILGAWLGIWQTETTWLGTGQGQAVSPALAKAEVWVLVLET